MILTDQKRETENKLARRIRGTLTAFIHEWHRDPDNRSLAITVANYKLRKALSEEFQRTNMKFGGFRPNPQKGHFVQDSNFLVGRVVDQLIDTQNDRIPRGEFIKKVRRWATGAAQRITQRDSERAKWDGVQRVHSGQILKRWISRMDGIERARHHDAHLRYQANPIPVNQPFIVGPWRARMMHPGDVSMNADPEDFMNCRCGTEYLDLEGHVIKPRSFTNGRDSNRRRQSVKLP